MEAIVANKDAYLLTTGSSATVSPGLFNLAMKFAHARPNTTRSSKELAPSLLAPWTEAHADSPAAQRPGTISSLPPFFVNACNGVKNIKVLWIAQLAQLCLSSRAFLFR